MNARKTLIATALALTLTCSTTHCMLCRALAKMCIPCIQTPHEEQAVKEKEDAEALEAEKTKFIKDLAGAWFAADLTQSVNNITWARKSIDNFKKKHGKTITEECEQKANAEVNRLLSKAFVPVEEISPGV